MKKYKSIAIDGPSGAGKSTIAKILAERINFSYLDTGAMYRMFTYYYLSENLDLSDENLVRKHIDKINLKIDKDGFYLNGKKVNKEIRSDQVTKNVSLISSYKDIRENLVDQQRAIASQGNIILDGRDIGTVVLKDADVKFFLTASVDERARRRYEQLNDPSLSLEAIKKDIERRDDFDSHREISPLRQAEDALLIDSSDYSIEETVELMIEKLEENNVI